jgi:hypothetical protein
MKSGLKLVLIYAAIAAVIFLLQLFPVTGVVLMLFLGMMWIGLLIHVGMLHIGIAAAVKRIPRAWLAIPILFYGGNLLLFAVTYYRANAESEAIERANVAARVQIGEPYTMLIHGSSPGLIEWYRIERLYQHEYNDYFSTWIYARGAVCDAKRGAGLIEGFYSVARADLFPDYRSPDKTRQCVLSRQGLPGDADYQYRIRPTVTQTRSGFRSRIDRQWTVTEEKTGAVVITAHTAKIGLWAPVALPLIGCSLNSGAARWDCGAAMLQWGPEVIAGYKAPPPTRYVVFDPPPVPEPEMLEVSAVARALSLPSRRPTD